MWLTALTIGFAGSLHCLGMCSPLVMAVTSMNPSALFNRMLYNAGRIATYALMGAAVAGVGMTLPLHKFQNIISIALGVTLLLIGSGGLKRLTIPGISWLMQGITQRLKNLFANYLRKKTRGAVFIMGILNGLLPCGLTFFALSWCLTLKGPLDGLNFMLLFGAGTLPVMLGFAGALPLLAKKFHWSVPRLTTTMLILSGCILIARVFIVHIPHTTAEEGTLLDLILCQ